MNKVTMLIITAALTVSAQRAHADTVDNSPRQQTLVRFSDLDVTRNAGVSILYGRLQRGARLVCEPLYRKDVQRSHAFDHCVTDAMARAVAEVAQPTLTAYYGARTKVQDRDAIALATTARR